MSYSHRSGQGRRRNPELFYYCASLDRARRPTASGSESEKRARIVTFSQESTLFSGRNPAGPRTHSHPTDNRGLFVTFGPFYSGIRHFYSGKTRNRAGIGPEHQENRLGRWIKRAKRYFCHFCSLLLKSTRIVTFTPLSPSS